MKITFSDQLAVTRNRPAGFDWLRIGLAVGVVSWHTVHISYGVPYQDAFYPSPFWRPPVAALLAMFFALSGFLVAGSLERCRSMVSFIGLRVMRIFPALVVEVLLSAIVLGTLLTQLPVAEYLSDPGFAAYFGNMLGMVHFKLPGVFAHNPVPYVVNGQLWTVPFELECYEVLTVLAVLGIYRHRWLLAAAVVCATGLMLRQGCLVGCNTSGSFTGHELVLCFLMGVVLYRFRASMRWSRPLALVSVLSAWAFMAYGGRADVLAALPLAYLTVFLGLCNPPRSRLLFSGDYSYGIFLYGFPVQQMVAALGPWAHHWYINLALTLPIAGAIAVLSWWLIEKPVLGRKSWLIALETWALGAASRFKTGVLGHTPRAGGKTV